jgi:hypothetical protein
MGSSRQHLARHFTHQQSLTAPLAVDLGLTLLPLLFPISVPVYDLAVFRAIHVLPSSTLVAGAKADGQPRGAHPECAMWTATAPSTASAIMRLLASEYAADYADDASASEAETEPELAFFRP